MTKIQHICVIGSGYDVHTRNRTQIFASMGYRITFITDLPGGLDDVDEILVDLPKNRTLAQFWGTLQFVKTIRDVDADVYMIHFPRRNSAWAAAIANVHPMVISVMGGDVNFDEYGAPLSRFQRDMTMAVLTKSDFIFSKTYYLSDVMKGLGVSANKLERVIWGIDLEDWYKREGEDVQLLRHQLNIDAGDYVLFSPKMMLPFYNIHIIMDALSHVIARFSNIKLIVSERRADSVYRQHIITQIETHNLQDHVVFVGDIPHHQMPIYYSLSDVVVTLASNDGLPQAMFEAMACEVPYILGDLPRYQEFVQDKAHVYFVDFTVESVANGVIELLSNQNLRTHMIEQARDLVQEIADIRKEAKRVINMMEQLDKDSSRKSGGIDIPLLFKFIGLGIQQFLQKILKRH